MEFNQNCSIKGHQEINAIKYCPECKLYLCNKCLEHHSKILEIHKIIDLNKDDKEDTFTGFCSIKNHKNELEYFCKDHNELICVECISKINTRGYGQHKDCNICDINDIINEKKNNLNNNIKELENLSEKITESIKELKIIFEEINKNKENIKLEVINIFTKLRNELNKR